MITGFISIVLGIVIFRYILHRSEKHNAMQGVKLDEMAEHYQSLIQQNEVTVKVLKKQLYDLQLTRELERGIVADSINRETRAKAALTAVLVQMKASGVQIQDVMREVDGSEGEIDGD